jgi:hypothetical protein
MVLKRFAQILGVVLILIGLVGLVLGDQVWLGILNVDIVEDIVHLATGGLLAYVGFSRMDLSTARSVVLALGVCIPGGGHPWVRGAHDVRADPARLHHLRRPAAPGFGRPQPRSGPQRA